MMRTKRSLIVRVFTNAALIAAIPLALATTAGADAVPATATTLVVPAEIPVAPLPFTGKKMDAFTTPASMANLTLTPSQGPIGTATVISGTGLPANAAVKLTWSTATSSWLTDVQPNTVNYLGPTYSKWNVEMAPITTDASGNFSYSTKIPEDFGGIHDIYVVQDGVALAHGGFQVARSITITPKSGPVGTPITIVYNGLQSKLYGGGGVLLYDNHYGGELMAQWTRGTATATIRAAGPVGTHYIGLGEGIAYTYLNIMQSPLPFANGDTVAFRVTKDKGPDAPSITWPTAVTPTVSQVTTLTTAGLDPNTKAVATLSQANGPVGTKVKLTVKDLPTSGDHSIVWSTVVGNRVNCASTCWAFNSLPLGQATVSDGALSTDVTVPDNLGGWHVIQVKKGDVVEAQVPFYVKESMVPFYDKNGKLLSMGVSTATDGKTPESFAVGGSGVGTYTFKEGEEFTISLKGVGWTQMDNTLAVTYDNAYIGYGCGFNSNGYLVIHLRATGGLGTHLIDLHPLLYTNSPSFPNTPYGMVPVLTSDRDFPGLALGYQIPTMHFAIKVVKG